MNIEAKLDKIMDKLDCVNGRLDDIEKKFEHYDATLEDVEQKFSKIEESLDNKADVTDLQNQNVMPSSKYIKKKLKYGLKERTLGKPNNF